MQEIIIENMAI